MRPGCAKGNLTGRGRMSISFADHARIMVGSYSRIGFLLVGTFHKFWAKILSFHVLRKSRRIGAFSDCGLVPLVRFEW